MTDRGRYAVHGPATVGWLLVALCTAAGGYCLLRLRGGGGERRGTAGGEALMGFGMAAMAVPAAVLAPPRWVWVAYALVFGAAALYALVRARSAGHHLHHLLGMLAMVYMAGAMAAAPTGAHGGGHGKMPGMSGAGMAGGVPLVTGLLLVYYAGYVLWAGPRRLPLVAVAAPVGGAGTAGTGGSGGNGGTGWGDRAELALACRLSMGLAMLAMLITL
ncbi:membrane protein [Streptomyces sp. AcH 505]|uniref:DUF5134 domain-containing protein n=1 Tax=Streptomyces sp. AcH 505 TaxID=352211 RepID=UPI000591D680|nr:membrane protein [Streptomyces sp. AcH 505]